MKKTFITLALTASIMLPGSAAEANDLVKALSLLQATSSNRYSNGSRVRTGHGHRDAVGRTVNSLSRDRDAYSRSSRSIARESARLRALERAEHLARLERVAERERLERLEKLQRARRRSRSTVSLRVGYQDVIPPAPVLPGLVPPAPLPAPTVRPPITINRPILPAPGIPAPVVRQQPHFDFGDLVDCEVPLYRRVRVRDRHNIARGARPMVVAVKAPGACDHACSCCADKVVYVRVMAPPCPPQSVTVSPCGRHVRMDFGKYEIDVVSTAKLVKVDYDN